MDIFDVLNLILGLSFFLFGIQFMGNALKENLEGKQSQLMKKLTLNPGKGFLLGVVVTAIIQSSSATTVMTVSLVHSGAIPLTQAVSVIFGANVGTSVTSFLTALSGIEQEGGIHSLLRFFKPSSFVPILAVAGLIFYSTKKNKKGKQLGSILFGFCILMVGMNQMSDAVSSLKENHGFQSALLMFENPILGIFAGAVLTAIIQSSSASIGILQSLTSTGAITFGNAVPIIMGQNIGTCITAMLASIGGSRDAKRIGMIHLLFNVIGSFICIILFYIVKMQIHISVLEGQIDMWGIALVHLLFNIISVVILYPLRRALLKATVFLIPSSKKED